jgi:hypothetical protein
MTSVGQDAGKRLDIDRNVGPWVYKIHGACHHITGMLLPIEGQQPSYAQHIWDPDQALDICMNNAANHDLDWTTMQILQTTLTCTHPSVALYKQAVERTAHLPDQNCRILLHFDSACDCCHYNLPGTANREIAVIIPGEGDEERDLHDIILHKRGGGLRCVNELSPMYVRSGNVMHRLSLYSFDSVTIYLYSCAYARLDFMCPGGAAQLRTPICNLVYSSGLIRA